MGEPIKLRRLLEFADVAEELTLINISVDFDGDPVMLFEEGRAPFPIGNDHEAIQQWYKTVPIAHHLLRYRSGEIEKLRILNSSGAALIRFAQPFLGGWLLVDSRSGNARAYDRNGQFLYAIDVGDAINDVQTTRDSLIWVGYFDEGVFGGGIGSNGLVCFYPTGEVRFKYRELAEKADLPPIDDCYALNVCEDRVWLSYYSDFPLVCLKDFELASWSQPGASFNAFAIRNETVVCLPAYGGRVVLTVNVQSGAQEELDPVDPNGIPLKDFRGSSYGYFASSPDTLARYKPFQAAGRNSNLYLYTEKTLYFLP